MHAIEMHMADVFVRHKYTRNVPSFMYKLTHSSVCDMGYTRSSFDRSKLLRV